MKKGFAWAAAFLLMIFLAAAVCTFFASEVLTSAAFHLETATDGRVLDDQLRRIGESVDLLAEEYGFQAETVRAAVTREALAEYNGQVAAWGTKFLTEGNTDPVPRWVPESLEKAVKASEEAGELKEDARTIVAELTEEVEKTVFPMRETLMTAGMRIARSKADIPGIFRALQKLPMLFAAIALLTGGLIALLEADRAAHALKYFGAALAGAGFVMLTAGAAAVWMQPDAMVAQASAGLAEEVRVLAGRIGLRAGAVTLALLAAGYGCLGGYRRIMRKQSRRAVTEA